MQTLRSMEDLCRFFDVESMSALLAFPLFFEIETTHLCNAKCRMCSIDTWPERAAFMDEGTFLRLASELKEHAGSIRGCTLCRDGEPLLDRGLEEKISLLKSSGIKNVVISTNASLLDQKRAVSILECGLDEIMFSVDGYTKETFEAIRGGLRFETVMSNILDFLAMRERRSISMKVRVRMIVQDLNIVELEMWKQYWKGLVRSTDKVYAKPVHNWGNQVDISGYIFKDIKNTAEACTALWSTMIIHSDGTVPVCSVDYNNKFLCGKVPYRSITDVWNSRTFSRLREQHLEGKRDSFDICRNCYLWDRSTIIEDKAV